jgi:hypothetical protein
MFYGLHFMVISFEVYLTCDGIDGLNFCYHSLLNLYLWWNNISFTSTRFNTFHSRSFAKEDKIKVLKTIFKTNPTNLKIHPRILTILRNISGVFKQLFLPSKTGERASLGGSGGGPSRDSVGGIPSQTTSSCGEVTG